MPRGVLLSGHLCCEVAAGSTGIGRDPFPLYSADGQRSHRLASVQLGFHCRIMKLLSARRGLRDIDDLELEDSWAEASDSQAILLAPDSQNMREKGKTQSHMQDKALPGPPPLTRLPTLSQPTCRERQARTGSQLLAQELHHEGAIKSDWESREGPSPGMAQRTRHSFCST